MQQRPHGGIISAFKRKFIAAPINEEEDEKNFKLACRFLDIMRFLWTEDCLFFLRISNKLAVIVVTLFTLLVSSGYIYYAVLLVKGKVEFDVGESMDLIMHFSLLLTCFPGRTALCFFFYDELASFATYTATFKGKLYAVHFMCEEVIISDESNINDLRIPIKNTSQKDNILRIPFPSFVLGCLGLSLFVVLRPLGCIFQGENCTPSVLDYFILFPFYDHVESMALFYVLTVISSIIGLYAMFSATPCVIYLLTLFCLMKHNALHLTERMRTFKLYFERQFEKMLQLERSGCDQSNSKNMLFSAFKKDMSHLLRTFQELSTSSRTFQKFMEIDQTLVVSTCWAVMLGIVSHMIMAKTMGTPDIVLCVTMTFVLLILLFVCCYMGKTFGDMGEVFWDAVYDLPWYYLPPNLRKMLNTFQLMLINGTELKILGIYPVDMAMFPRVLSSVFSYANILRTVSHGESAE